MIIILYFVRLSEKCKIRFAKNLHIVLYKYTLLTRAMQYQYMVIGDAMIHDHGTYVRW